MLLENLSNAVFSPTVIISTKDFAIAIWGLAFVLLVVAILMLLMINAIRKQIEALQKQLRDGTLLVRVIKPGEKEEYG